MLSLTAGGATISQLETPCLLLDEVRMTRNIARLRCRLDRLGVAFRPHLKTAKSQEVASRLMSAPSGPAAVSTLREAEVFAAHGVRDLLYAVGVAPGKLDRVAAIRAGGCDLAVILDSIEATEAVTRYAAATGARLPVLIEVDTDGHRGGVGWDDARQLVAIGRLLHEGGAELRGVLAHAGESYGCTSAAELRAAAEQERARATHSASILRNAGLPCPVVSTGSTPTAHFAEDLTGVTEVRAGVFVFFDLVMAGIGVCDLDDIAISVLATVIGRQPERGRLLVDAGWMAMSRDRGTARQKLDQGYGVACDVIGQPYTDLIMVEASQEHGILALRPGSAAALPDLPLGAKVRILPNHACPTAAQYDRYHVVQPGAETVTAVWTRFGGW